MLLEVIHEDCIKSPRVSAKDWREVGRMAGQLLVDKGHYRAWYIEAALVAGKSSVGHCGGAGIALFHSRRTTGSRVGLEPGYPARRSQTSGVEGRIRCALPLPWRRWTMKRTWVWRG